MLRKLLNRKNQKRQDGFTIIEVMIVLAIAGLILVVVLIAIPQLQRNQRDTARQNVASRLASELGTYATNNNGAYPFAASGNTMADFVSRYVGGVSTGTPPAPVTTTPVVLELRNPQTGNQYQIVQATATATAPTADQILIYPGGQCNGEAVGGTISAASRQFALRVALERGNTFFCADNI